ncbi:MAG: hypothetical protein JSV79_09970 [Armatimonadota bacterium]|nr:MAG: hypothetical protein JSV79_09970 [Armatimonadota bacterium]
MALYHMLSLTVDLLLVLLIVLTALAAYRAPLSFDPRNHQIQYKLQRATRVSQAV